MTIFAQLSKCLYCVWPALVAGIVWWLMRGVEGKTFYGSLTPGVDPVSPQGQAEFETRRSRDAEKRRIIYWAIGIVAAGYLGALLFNTFTLRAAAAIPTATPTRTVTRTPTRTVTGTFTPALPSPTGTPTQGTGTPTYVPTATDRIVYVAGPQTTVIVTVVVPKQIIVIATYTFTYSPTLTPTGTASPTGTPVPTSTSTPTASPSPTETPSPTSSETPTGSATPTETPTGT
jgi:hypothetical protein